MLKILNENGTETLYPSVEMAMQNGVNEQAAEMAAAEFEREEILRRRQAAYRAESDPLFAEAYRKEAAGDTEGAQIARAAGLAAVEEIKQRFPIE